MSFVSMAEKRRFEQSIAKLSNIQLFAWIGEGKFNDNPEKRAVLVAELKKRNEQ